MVIAALVARIFGRGRSALGAGGGRAATWGAAASRGRLAAVGALVGTTTGGVSPSADFVRGGSGGEEEPEERADIMAWRWGGVHVWWAVKAVLKRRDACWARWRRATVEAMVVVVEVTSDIGGRIDVITQSGATIGPRRLRKQFRPHVQSQVVHLPQA